MKGRCAQIWNDIRRIADIAKDVGCYNLTLEVGDNFDEVSKNISEYGKLFGEGHTEYPNNELSGIIQFRFGDSKVYIIDDLEKVIERSKKKE